MSSNTVNFPTTILSRLSFNAFKFDYWKSAMIIIAATVLAGYAFQLITGIATIALTVIIGVTLIVKSVRDIMSLDFSLENLDLRDIHDDLWE